MTQDVDAIELAGHDLAEQLLDILDRDRTDPKVGSIALIFAAAIIIGRVATDENNLAAMSKQLGAILTTHASECWEAFNADTTLTRN
jgi:hypothetical protein